MKGYWNLTHGLGWSKYNASFQGIPDSNPKWVRRYCENGAGFDPLVSYSDHLYFLSGGSKSRPIFSIDIQSGELNWKSELPAIDNILPSLCATSQHLLVSDILLAKNGEEIENLAELLNQDNPQADTPYDFGNKYILRIINHEVDAHRYFLYNLSTKEHQVILLPVIFGTLTLGSDLVYGFIQEDDSDYLVCCSLEGGIIWKVASSLGTLIFNENILNLTTDNILLHSSKSGKLIKRINSMENKFTEDSIYSFNKSYCLDTVNMLSNGDLSIFSITEDKLINKIEGCDIHDYCVSGDLIFTCQNTWDLVAYDRYSGQEVWRYTERYAWQSMIASNNRLIVYCATGDIVCFNCGDEYVSSYNKCT